MVQADARGRGNVQRYEVGDMVMLNDTKRSGVSRSQLRRPVCTRELSGIDGVRVQSRATPEGLAPLGRQPGPSFLDPYCLKRESVPPE
jgi:hypothetical protein